MLANDILDLNDLYERVGREKQKELSNNRQRLNQAIRSMLSNQEESEFPPILRTIDRHLRQYRLCGRIDPYDVFNEACNRALKKIERGEEISLLPAWFRTTSFYIVCEWSRKHRQYDDVGSIDAEDFQEQPHPCSVTDRLDLIAMREAYGKLPPLDRKILLMHASGMTWEDVARQLIQSGEQSGDHGHVTQSIAQRAHRARRRLRDTISS